jgi:tetratricopeptide (TPR) repeat protein
MERRTTLLLRIFLIGSILIRTPAVSWVTNTAAAAENPAAGCCKGDSDEVAQLLKNADRLYAQFKPHEAAADLAKVLQVDADHFEALARLARAHIDIGDSVPVSARDWQEQRVREYRRAEAYARRAISVNPKSTWGHFYLAASLGHIAVLSSTAEQVDLAGEVREEIEKSIALDPRNGFAYHVYGVWHRKMAEVGQTSRMFASVLYGRSVPAGSLDKSIEYLNKAVTLNPRVIASRLELAKSYVAVEDWQMARRMLSSIRDLPRQFSDDARHKREAEELLKQINDR